MKTLIQRVSQASARSGSNDIQIGPGLLVKNEYLIDPTTLGFGASVAQ